MRISDWSSDVCSSDLRRALDARDLVDRHRADLTRLITLAIVGERDPAPGRQHRFAGFGTLAIDARDQDRDEVIEVGLDRLCRPVESLPRFRQALDLRPPRDWPRDNRARIAAVVGHKLDIVAKVEREKPHSGLAVNEPAKLSIEPSPLATRATTSNQYDPGGRLSAVTLIA